MSDLAVTLLVVVCLLQAAVIAVLAALVPVTWFRTMSNGERVAKLEAAAAQLRRDVDEVDEVLDTALDAEGAARPRRRQPEHNSTT